MGLMSAPVFATLSGSHTTLRDIRALEQPGVGRDDGHLERARTPEGTRPRLFAAVHGGHVRDNPPGADGYGDGDDVRSDPTPRPSRHRRGPRTGGGNAG